MKKVFIGGSRHVSTLSSDIQSRLEKIIALRYSILVGDANGVDKAVQAFLKNNKYHDVEVFCSLGECRNNLDHWPIRPVPTEEKRGTFGFYSAKDRAMADEASIGFMIWDGKSKGTLMNVSRLVEAGKSATICINSLSKFISLKSITEWEQFLSTYGSEMRDDIEKLAASERLYTRELQSVLF